MQRPPAPSTERRSSRRGQNKPFLNDMTCPGRTHSLPSHPRTHQHRNGPPHLHHRQVQHQGPGCQGASPPHLSGVARVGDKDMQLGLCCLWKSSAVAGGPSPPCLDVFSFVMSPVLPPLGYLKAMSGPELCRGEREGSGGCWPLQLHHHPPAHLAHCLLLLATAVSIVLIRTDHSQPCHTHTHFHCALAKPSPSPLCVPAQELPLHPLGCVSSTC